VSRALSATSLAALLAQETEEVFLFLAEINHADWASPVRIVNDNQDLTSNGDTFVAFPFDVELVSEEPDRVATTVLKVCNVDRQIIALFDALATKPTVALSIVIASEPDTVIVGPQNFQITEYKSDQFVIEATLAYEDILNEPMPCHSYLPSDFPGLH